jgi:protein tyrosine phosphatase (PTP) superfamily phosphohydrolase (DUF442 family)
MDGAWKPDAGRWSARGVAAALVMLSMAMPLRLDAEDVPAAPVRIEAAGLKNLFRVTDRVFSGSRPDGSAAFAEIARLGVKTIVSVDGIRPDVQDARRFGLRYVHLPLGYDGIPGGRVAELASVATAFPGRIYVHCHHGQHRGPAAVGVICEAVHGWAPEKAEAWLRQAGTAEDYPGLFRAVRDFQPVKLLEIERVGELPEVANTAPLVDAMVAMDERLDRLIAARKAGWKVPADSPERSPSHDATLLLEHYRELARAEDTAERSGDYRAKLSDAEKMSAQMRELLGAQAPEPAALDAALDRVSKSCVECHKAHRN